MITNLPILSLAIFIPLISALYITFFIGHSKSDHKDTHAIYVAMLASLFTFIVTFSLMLSFDSKLEGFQFVEKYDWIESIGLEFFIGVDGLSIYFIFLTSLLTMICITISLFTIKKKIKEFLLCFLLLESFCIGAFSALNLLLFYIFFEVVLIPMYMIIGVWGAQDRIYAALKFFLYTFFGSVFFLVALIYIYLDAGTFSIIDLPEYLPNLPLKIQKILWLATFLTIAIKAPMIPFHTWLPDAHVQAPTSGSVMLAGILLKLGGYAMLRISLPMFPDATEYFARYIIYFSAFAVVYASYVALRQTDMKKMIAYSSVAHMGYVTGGIFTCSVHGINAAIFQMLSHGVISSALFLIVGILYERHHTKEISKYGGVVNSMPVLSLFFMIAMLGSVGLPGTSGFIGEFLSIVSIFDFNIIPGIFCACGVVLGALYMLKLYKDLIFGNASDEVLKFSDIQLYEVLTLLPLVILIIYFGINPNVILSTIDVSVLNLVNIYKI